MRARDKWHDRMKDVDKEFRASEVAAELLEQRLTIDPAFLDDRGLGARDAERLRERLEGTYLIRLFAVFETGLREVWVSAFQQTSRPPAEHLIDGISARRTVPGNLSDEVHLIRRYRNALVHSGEESAVAFESASRSLNRFFARLPPTW